MPWVSALLSDNSAYAISPRFQRKAFLFRVTKAIIYHSHSTLGMEKWLGKFEQRG